MTKITDFLLRNIFTFLLGKENINIYHTLDWEQAILPFKNQKLTYPAYYEQQNFHGIENGYLNPIASITYDFVIAFATPPNEQGIRQEIINQISVTPKNILDLGCGTGSTTVILKKAFPEASVTGLDLSPYMLWMAEHKAKKEGLIIQWHHSLAEETNFPAHSFDLITIAMVFHETPPEITQLILRECHRLLSKKGQLIILDGHQKKLRSAKWLIKLFREPYSEVYAQGDINQWLKHANFINSDTKSIGWINQITNVQI